MIKRGKWRKKWKPPWRGPWLVTWERVKRERREGREGWLVSFWKWRAVILWRAGNAESVQFL